MSKKKENYYLILLVKIRYLISLKRHQIIINKLDLNNKINAIINNFVNEQIYELINEKIIDKDKNIIKILKEETLRIDALTDNYKYGFIEPMTFEEMRSIINYYINDDIWSKKKIEQKLNILFQKTKKLDNYSNHQIIYFNPQK